MKCKKSEVRQSGKTVLLRFKFFNYYLILNANTISIAEQLFFCGECYSE